MEDSDKLVGQSLKGTRGVYKLTRYLNEGRTARVYSAEATLVGGETATVAVKSMRPGLSLTEQKAFREETMYLAQLQGLNAAAAPQYYEHFSTDIPQMPEVLILELMTGVKVEDLLVRDGPLPEPEALNLGVQLAGILQIVHEGMARTYTDLKFENLWWERGTGRLKLLDWNVLSDVGKLERVPADLLRAARYLYRILTGGEAREDGGIVVTPFMRHPNWQTLSRPLQAFLRKALHRNPDLRFASAAEQVSALKTILRLWQQDSGRLLTTVEQRLGEEYDRDKYENALETLDVLRRRRDSGEQFAPGDSARLDALLTRVEGRLSTEQTLLERGRHLFDGRSYKEARELFAKSVEENPWDLAGWRWREAASAGAQTNDFERVGRDVSFALDALNGGEYDRAEQILSRIQVAALGGLRAEAQAQRLLAEAQKLAADGRRLVDAGEGQSPEVDDLLRRAQDTFGKAADAMHRITPDDYRLQVRGEIGDPAVLGRALADEQRSLAAAAAMALRAAQQAAAEGDWARVETQLRSGLEAVPTDRKLSTAARELGIQRFDAGDTVSAAALLAIASRYTAEDPSARRLLMLVRQTSEAVALFDGLHWQSGLAAMAEVLAIPADAAAKTTAEQTLRNVADRSFESLTLATEPETVDRVLKQVETLSLDRVALQGWAARHTSRRNALLKEWTTTRIDAWSTAELLNFAPRVWQLVPAGSEQQKLADVLLPVVRKHLEACSSFGDSSPAPALLQLYRQLAEVQPAAAQDAAFPDNQYCRLVAADVAAQETKGWQAALQAARTALARAPENLRGPLAVSLQPSLGRTLLAVPANSDLNAAASVLSGAQEALDESPALRSSPWALAVDAYRREYQAEQTERRNRAYESVHSYIAALRAAGDEQSYAKARASLDQALLLTPEGSPTRGKLTALGAELEAWRHGFAVSQEDLAKVRAVLAELPEQLAIAATPDDLATLRTSITEAGCTAEQANEHDLLRKCAEAQRRIDEIEHNLGRVHALEGDLAQLQERLNGLEGNSDLPGIAEAREEVWRRIATTAGTISALQPGHPAATKAREAYQQHAGAVALDSRLEMYRSLREKVGPHAGTIEQAHAAFDAGQLAEAAGLLKKMPEEWQTVPDAETLRRQIKAGEEYLQRVEALKAKRGFDDAFDQELRDLLTVVPSPALAAQANIGAWMQGRRMAALAALTRAKRQQKPDLLLTAVLADQYARAAGMPVKHNGPSLAPDDVAQQVMAPDKNGTPPAGDLIAALPAARDPRVLAQEVRDLAAAQLVPSAGGSGRKTGRILATAIPVVLAALLLAYIAWFDMPGFAPDSRTKANASVAALTANPPTAVVQTVQQKVTVPVPVTVVVTVPVQVVATPTLAPIPTEAPTLAPAAVQTITATTTVTGTGAISGTAPLPLATPTPGLWNDAARRKTFTDASGKAVAALQGAALPAIAGPDSVVAVVDDKDPGAGLVLNGQPATTAASKEAGVGLFRGMSFVQLSALQPGLQFQWPAVWLAEQGHYGAYIFVPSAHGMMTVRCTLRTGGASPTGLSLAGLPEQAVDQAPLNNQWVYLGDFQMAAPGEVVLSCEPSKMPAGSKGPTQAGFDAAALVRLP